MKGKIILILVIVFIIFASVLYYTLTKPVFTPQKTPIQFPSITKIPLIPTSTLSTTTTPSSELEESFEEKPEKIEKEQLKDISELEEMKAEITPELIQKEFISRVEKSDPGLIYYGTIKNIQNNKITLEIKWIDPLHLSVNTNKVTITLNPQDEILKYRREPNGKMEEIKISLKDLKVNDYVLVSTGQDKKIITLLSLKIPQP